MQSLLEVIPPLVEVLFCCKRASDTQEQAPRVLAGPIMTTRTTTAERFLASPMMTLRTTTASDEPSLRGLSAPSCRELPPAAAGRDIVLQLSELAARLEGPATHFSKTVLRRQLVEPLVASRTNCYLAVGPDSEEGCHNDLSWCFLLRTWRRGKLQYWADQEAWEGKEDPEGFVHLMNIVKVGWVSKTPLEVCVRHKDDDGSASDMFLQFATVEDAQAWGQALHELRALLQRTIMCR